MKHNSTILKALGKNHPARRAADRRIRDAEQERKDNGQFGSGGGSSSESIRQGAHQAAKEGISEKNYARNMRENGSSPEEVAQGVKHHKEAVKANPAGTANGAKFEGHNSEGFAVYSGVKL